MSAQESARKRRRTSEVAFAAYESDSGENSLSESEHDSIDDEQCTHSFSLEQVLTTFRKIFDAKAQIHGSQAFGLAFEDSDIDILVEKPLLELLARLREESCRGFSLIEYISTAHVPRLILKHKESRAILDCVEFRKDPHALRKDELVRKWLALGPEVAVFMKNVRLWARRSGSELPRNEGYPNSYLLLVTALCFLRQQLGVSLDDQYPAGPPEVLKLVKLPMNLLEGWLVFLRDDAPRLQLLDLRTRIPKLDSRGSSNCNHICQPWSLIEPISGDSVMSLSGIQAEQLARLTILYSSSVALVTTLRKICFLHHKA